MQTVSVPIQDRNYRKFNEDELESQARSYAKMFYGDNLPYKFKVRKIDGSNSRTYQLFEIIEGNET